MSASGDAVRRIVRRAGSAALALAAAAGLAACGGDDAPTSPTVLAGLSDRQDPTIAVLEYLPASVTVTAGSTVEWRISGPVSHSVTFFPAGQPPPAPGSDASLFAPTPSPGAFDGTSVVSSGVTPSDPGTVTPFEVMFPTAGSYTYQCLVHPLMTGTVDVVEPGGDVDTPAQVRSRTDAELGRWLEEGREAKRALERTSPRSQRAPDGTTSWRIEMGATTEHTHVLAFVPSAAEVRPNDRVVFVNDTGAPHTATFAGPTQVPQDPASPQVAAPAPGPSPQALDAGGFFNTGILPPNAPPGSGPPEPARSFTFVVPTAGTYSYVCVLHRASGMAGSIKVA